MTFCRGEDVLSAWMADSAFVFWTLTEEPWMLETELIETFDLPLNIDQNVGSPLRELVREVRRTAKEVARCSPVRGL
jgi:hypothetical protein